MKDYSLKSTFNASADFYDVARPKYPPELFETIIRKADLNSTSKLLEIGPGTGQATLPFAKQGLAITAIEYGDKLAQKCSENLSNYPNVNIICGDFETADLPKKHIQSCVFSHGASLDSTRVSICKTSCTLKR